MGHTDAQVSAIEEACLETWDDLFAGLGASVPRGVPPRRLYLVYQYCKGVAARLPGDFDKVRVVKGVVAQHEHAWIECIMGGDRVILDVAVQEKTCVYLVKSERSLRSSTGTSQKTGDMYYQRIAVISTPGAISRYQERIIDNDGALELPLAPPCTGKFARAFMEILRNVHAPRTVGDDVDVTKLRAVMANAIGPGGDDHPFLPHAVRCIVTAVRRCGDPSQCISREETRGAVRECDAHWKVLFNEKNVWKRHVKKLCILHDLSSEERTNIDTLTAVYYQVVHALISIADTTDELASTPPPLAWCASVGASIGAKFIVSMLQYALHPNTAGEDIEHPSSSMKETYRKVFILFMEEFQRAVCYVHRKHRGITDQQVSGFKALELSCIGSVERENKETVVNLFDHAYKSLDPERPFVPHLLALLETWKALETTGDIYNHEHYKAISGTETPSALVEEAQVYSRGSHVLSCDYDDKCTKYIITAMSIEGVEVEGVWEEPVIFEDYMGGSWEVEVDTAQAREAGTVGRIGTMLNALCLSHKLVDAQRMRVVSGAGNTVSVWHVLVPMLRAITSPITHVDAWDRYIGDVHLATMLLQYKCQSVLVDFPSNFAIPALDPSKHHVDQWVMYFERLPPSVLRLLDVTRQRHSVVFKIVEGKGRLCTVVEQTPPPWKLIGPKDVLPPEMYDRAIETLVADWLYGESSAKNSGLTALVVVQGDILVPSFLKNLTRRRVPVTVDDIPEKYSRFARLVGTTLHRGMVFASLHKKSIELFFHRDTSYFFESEYVIAMSKLKTGIEFGNLADADLIPTMSMSGGYLVSQNTDAPIETVTLTEHNWDDSKCNFLRDWVQDHLRHVVHHSHVGVRISNKGIDILPTLARVCSQRSVIFTVTAQLRNPLERIDRTFSSAGTPVYTEGAYRVKLGEDLCLWIKNFAVSYMTAERQHVCSAPYTTAKIVVTMAGDGFKSKPVAVFSVNSPKKDSPTGDLVVTYKKTPKHTVELETYEKRVDSSFSALLAAKAPSSFEGAPREDALRGCEAMVVARHFQCRNGKPVHDNLLARITEDEFARMVAQEYYRSPFLHPVVTEAYFDISVQKFASIVYGEKTPFIDSMQ